MKEKIIHRSVLIILLVALGFSLFKIRNQAGILYIYNIEKPIQGTYSQRVETLEDHGNGKIVKGEGIGLNIISIRKDTITFYEKSNSKPIRYSVHRLGNGVFASQDNKGIFVFSGKEVRFIKGKKTLYFQFGTREWVSYKDGQSIYSNR